jgi:putative addiction module component (TIGR02574 family)
MQMSARCRSEVAGVTIDELMREALALDPQGRAHLAHRLLDSLDELTEAELEQLWLAEAARRDAAIDAGAPTFPADEVLARARARRG